jgi:hypothetical protein
MVETRETIARHRGIQAIKPLREPAFPRRRRNFAPFADEPAQDARYDLMKIPFRFISNCCGFGENFSPSVLLIRPALISR